jgi:hypothetical protein
MKCDEFVILCIFGTHTYSLMDFYMYMYFALILYEIMSKLAFEPAITCLCDQFDTIR